MKLVKPSFEILEQGSGLQGLEEQIEKAARTCYKSEEHIKDGSAHKMVNMLIKSGHGAMLEHGTVYLRFPSRHLFKGIKSFDIARLNANNYTHNVCGGNTFTTNYRVIVDKGWEWMLKYMCDPSDEHYKRVTVRFTCDVGVSREFNRHRVNSMAEQSTRYCNFSKDKFGKELTIIRPEEISEEEVTSCYSRWSRADDSEEAFRYMCGALSSESNDPLFGIIDTWLFANLACEWSYNHLIELGWKPEQARRVLPLDLKTEIVHTAFVSDWLHFFDLRCAKDAHPQARELAVPLREEFKKRGLLSEDECK